MIDEVVLRGSTPGRLARDFEEVFDSGSPRFLGPGFTQASLLKCFVPELSLKSVFVWVCGIPFLSSMLSDVPGLD